MFSSNLSDLMLGAHDIREESASFPFHLECNTQLQLPACKENSVTVISYIHLQNYIPFFFHHLVVKYSFNHCKTLCFLPNHPFLVFVT